MLEKKRNILTNKEIENLVNLVRKLQVDSKIPVEWKPAIPLLNAGRVLNLSRSTTYHYARAGLLPTVMVGVKIYVPGWFMDGLYQAGLFIENQEADKC